MNEVVRKFRGHRQFGEQILAQPLIIEMLAVLMVHIVNRSKA